MLMLMLVPMKMLLLLKLIAVGRACRAEVGHLEEEEGELAGTVAAVEQQEDDGGRTDQGVLCRICQRGLCEFDWKGRETLKEYMKI